MPARTTQLRWIVVIAVAIGAIAFGCWHLQQDVDAPQPFGNDPEAGAPGVAGQQAEIVRSGSGTSSEPTEANGPGTMRVSVADAQRPDEACRLQVLLQCEHEQRVLPAPFVDVSAHLSSDPTIRAVARSDQHGRASFSFVGGHEQQVVIAAGIGGRTTSRLDADETVQCSLTVTARAHLTGRVVDTFDAAVAGADVLLLHWPWRDEHDAERGGDLWRIGRADRDGLFSIPCGVGGRIGAEHELHSSSAMYLVRAAPAGKPPALQKFVLVLGGNGGRVRGIVVDASDRPVAGATVELATAADRPRRADLAGPPRRLRTEPDGTFTTRGIAEGAVRFAAKAPGHGWVRGTSEHHRAADEPIRIVLPRPSSISGKVVADTPDGPPVANAIVTVGDPDSLCHARTRTDADGTFRLPDLGNGRVPVRAVDGKRSAATPVELTAGQHRETQLVLTGTNGDQLSGVVVDERDRPLPGWLIVARQGRRTPGRARSDHEGNFSMAIEQTSDLDVRAYAPGRAPTSFADVRLQGVDATAGPLRIVASPQVTTKIIGRVVDSNYTGVPATVGCFHHERREYARFTCDEAGNFHLAQVPLGDVNLTVEYEGHVTYEGATVPLDRSPRDLGTIQLDLGGSLFGSVYGPDGTPPPSCRLVLVNDRDQRTFRGEYLDGGYTFQGLPAGDHQLLARGEGLAGQSFAVTIVAGQSQQRDLELQRGLRRRIRVLVPPGGGRRVTLAVRAAEGGMRWFATNSVARTREGTDGEAEFLTWMLSGSYTVIAATPTGHRARRTVTYTMDDDVDVVLRVTN